jgi:CRP-like cAMP-binding protein
MTSTIPVLPAPSQGNHLFDILLRHAESDLPDATRRLARGERLIRQGDTAEDFFLLRSGRLRIERDGVKLASIHPGQTVGEMAFLTRGERTASVIADRDSIVIRIDRAQYATLCARHPRIAQSIAEDLALRLERTNARVAQDHTPAPATTIAILAGGDPNLLPGFVAALTASLSTRGPAPRIGSTRSSPAATPFSSLPIPPTRTGRAGSWRKLISS